MKVFCHQCGKRTNHNVLAEEKIRPDDHDTYHWSVNHYFARCAGCDAFTYAIEEWCEDDWNPHTEEMEST